MLTGEETKLRIKTMNNGQIVLKKNQKCNV